MRRPLERKDPACKPRMRPPDDARAEAGDIPTLIRALDTTNVCELRRVSRSLIAAGNDAAPALTEALASGIPGLRKAAAYLLGAGAGSAEVIRALARSVLEDPVPKVRQNAAVSLGKIGTPEEVPVLARALEQEAVSWVRRSLILALGKIGGAAAHAALLGVSPRDDTEPTVLRLARERALPQRQRVTWRRGHGWL